MTFDHIANWKLLRGSHDFPGPDGGTCINEAAIIAAGFPYKAVKSASDCPSCFSRPLASFAIYVNDSLPNDQRHLLMPFVTRLAGTADTPEIERARSDFLIVGLFNHIYAPTLRAMGIPAAAARCEGVRTLADVKGAALALDLALARALDLALDLARALARARALDLALDLALDRDLATAKIELLEGALAIGRQADPLDGPLIVGRMEAAKRRAVEMAE